MNINATLLVQMFNFFLVYGMLRFLLFRPVIAIIEQEKAQKNALDDIIEQQKKSLEIQEKERQGQWYNCREYFINHQPAISNISAPQSPLSSDEIENDIGAHSLSPENIQNIVSKIRNALEEKIKHVH